MCSAARESPIPHQTSAVTVTVSIVCVYCKIPSRASLHQTQTEMGNKRAGRGKVQCRCKCRYGSNITIGQSCVGYQTSSDKSSQSRSGAGASEQGERRETVLR